MHRDLPSDEAAAAPARPVRRRSFLRHAVARAVALAMAPAAWGAPGGGTVSAGQAQIVRSGNLTSITQQSGRAVIDWASFGIGANEAVAFRQPATSSVTLNRVLGADPSAIFGHLSANGRVYLVNPNGVLFGAGAQVDVGGLVAATANITNANFMAGIDRFDQPGAAGATVENRGTLRAADHGIVALVGRQVSNSGFIVAHLGKVALAGGDAFVLDLSGERLVNLVLDPAVLEQVRDSQGRPLIARVDNTGSIVAGGGRVQLSADTVSRLLDNVINVQGDIRATSVESADGVISLEGGATTDLTVGGVLQAQGRAGRVAMAARDITLAASAQIDMGSGASLQLDAARDATLDAALNGLRSDAVAGGAMTANAGRNLTVRQSIALNDAALVLTAGQGTLGAANGTTLQAGSQAITLKGAAGVAVDRVLTSGSVDIESSAGSVSVASALVAPAAGTAASPVAALTVRAGQDVALAGALAAGDIAVQAGGAITAGGSLAAGGALGLASGGALVAAQALSGRGIALDAGGPVTLAGASAGAAGLAITARQGDVLSPGAGGGLVSAADLSVAAAQGHAGTAAAPLGLGAGGGASVEGRDGVALAALIAPGAVSLRSTGGGVGVASAIAGSADAVLANAAPAAQLSVQAAGDVSLAGARVGPGGVSVGAASFALNGGSLLSEGAVGIATSGRVALDAGVQAGGNVVMASSAGPLAVGVAGIRATGAGHGIDLSAGGDLKLDGDLQADAGRIALSSTGGSVTARVATPGANPGPGDALVDAGSDAASQIAVSARGDVVLGDLRAGGGVGVTSTAGNVQLLTPLGGATTGYQNHADGYQGALRPAVGTLAVSAPAGSVELNGLNLDGLADPHASGSGLSVTAGHIVLSNALIAVNKGDVVLQGGPSGSDGVYLGASVYSRGWDSTGTDHTRGGTGSAADEKLGYGVRISGHNLGLFDNNTDVADLPGLFAIKLPDGTTVYTDSQGFVVDNNGVRGATPQRVVKDNPNNLALTTDIHVVDANLVADDHQVVLGQAIPRTVAKIEIGNNVANYQDPTQPGVTPNVRDTLVPLTNPASQPKVNLDVDVVGGVVNHAVTTDGGAADRPSLTGFAPVLGALSEAQSRVTPSTTDGPKVPSTRGIALKLLGFELPGDRATEIWSDVVAFSVVDNPSSLDPNSIVSSESAFPTIQGTAQRFSTSDGTATAPVGGALTIFVKDDLSRPRSDGGTDFCTGCVANYRLQRLPGVLSSYVTVQGILAAPDPGDPLTSGWSGLYDTGSTFQVRFVGNPFVSTAGRSAGIEVRGNLLATGGSPFGGPLTQADRLSPVASADLNSPRLAQASNGSISPRVGQEDLTTTIYPPGYLVGRVLADTSAPGTYDPSRISPDTQLAPGTRVLVFDGVLDTAIGRASADAVGANNYVPGFAGISLGKNNSTTGFTSIGASTSANAGTSAAVGIGAAVAIPGTGGVADAGGFIAAPSLPVDPGFINVPDVSRADRSTQDAMQSARTDPPVAETPGSIPPVVVELGVGPATEADLGRGGGVAGAATNVFKRSYRVAATTDTRVCAPGAIEPASDRGDKRAPAGGCKP